MQRYLTFLLLLLLCTGAANAGAVYSDQSAFLAALPDYYLENFNSIAPGLATSWNFAGGTYAYTASTPHSLYAGPWAGDGQLFGPNFEADPLTFTFTSGNVTAVGGYFFLTDANNVVIPGTVTLNFSDGTSAFLSSNSPVSFFGYTSGVPLTSLVISGPGEGYWVSLDNMYVGGDVPEPATAILLGIGLSLCGLLKRRRR